MARLQKIRSLVLLAICFFLMQVTIGAAVVHVNETVGNFTASFDARDDTSIIAKTINWTIGPEKFGNLSELSGDFYMVLAYNKSDAYNRWSGVAIFIFKTPINTSDVEKDFSKNITAKYVRLYNRVIDGHKGILAQTGNSSEDPLMNYTAIYWLDETNGFATKLVFVITGFPWNEGAETLIDTVHVEEISRAAQIEVPGTQKIIPLPKNAPSMPKSFPSPYSISSNQSGEIKTTNGASIQIPIGAIPLDATGSPGTMTVNINADTAIAPTLPGGFVSMGPVYTLGPEGFVFSRPVKLTLPIPDRMDANHVKGLAIFNNSSNKWEIFPAAVDPQNRTVTMETIHFSRIVVVGLSGSIDTDQWSKANGGWIVLSDNYVTDTMPYVGCTGEKCGNTVFQGLCAGGKCGNLPKMTLHGVCIISYTLANPQLASIWSPATWWNTAVRDIVPAFYKFPNQEKFWVPAGTYVLQEYYYETEDFNIGPGYQLCTHWYVKPVSTVTIGPGTIRDFGEFDPTGATCVTKFHCASLMGGGLPYSACNGPTCSKPCPPGQTNCGGVCVDTQSDSKNCGICGNACPLGESCCSGACVDAQSDPKNCGICGNACPLGESCCNGACLDTQSDPKNCGICGNACPLGESCCNGACVDTQSDPKNCGICGNACQQGESCVNWSCSSGGISTPTQNTYAVFLLKNLAGGSIWVGSETDLNKTPVCNFPGGGLCRNDGKDVLVQYVKESKDFASYDDAQAAYCAAPKSNVRTFISGTKANIYGGDYWIDTAPSCSSG